MNIENIKNYNQKMLAIIGTIVLLFVTVGLISLIVVMINEIIPYKRNTKDTLISDNKVDKLKQDSLRLQIISYSTPKLIDTTNLIYIISANIKTLNHPEPYDEGLLDVFSSTEADYSPRKYPGKRLYGTFVNLIEYDYKNNSAKKICNERIVGTDMSFETFKDEIMVIFKAALQDTDDDDKVTPDDFSSLFIYSIKDKKLRKISYNNATIESWEYIANTKDLLITFGFDRNKNKLYEKATEPTFIMKYDYKNDALIKIVDRPLESEIQNIIDNNIN